MAEEIDLITLTVDVVSAYVGQNNIRAEDVPGLISSTHAALAALKSNESVSASADVENEFPPAVTVRKSLASKDHIVSMIDGKPYKALRRHLRTQGLTPEEYCARYKLPDNYPMVAENYSAQRRDLAKTIGLGRKPGQKRTSKPKAN